MSKFIIGHEIMVSRHSELRFHDMNLGMKLWFHDLNLGMKLWVHATLNYGFMI